MRWRSPTARPVISRIVWLRAMQVVRYAADGSKELYAKKSGTRLRLLSKPNPKYAKK